MTCLSVCPHTLRECCLSQLPVVRSEHVRLSTQGVSSSSSSSWTGASSVLITPPRFMSSSSVSHVSVVVSGRGKPERQESQALLWYFKNFTQKFRMRTGQMSSRRGQTSNQPCELEGLHCLSQLSRTPINMGRYVASFNPYTSLPSKWTRTRSCGWFFIFEPREPFKDEKKWRNKMIKYNEGMYM